MLLSMSYKKDVIPTPRFSTQQLKKGRKQGQLIKKQKSKNRNAAINLQIVDFLRSKVIQLEILKLAQHMLEEKM